MPLKGLSIYKGPSFISKQKAIPFGENKIFNENWVELKK